MKPSQLRTGFAFAAFLVVFAATGGEARAKDGLPLFADKSTLAVTIEGPISTLIRTRDDEEYLDGLFRYTEADGTEKVLDIKFRARGNYRRQRKTCRLPPVRLNFDKDQLEGTLFEGQNILKLVTHCRPGSDRYEEYVAREKIAYDILNLLTPASFRARMFHITWVDTDGKNDSELRYGFVIEHKNELERRLGMQEVTANRISYDDLEERQGATAALFQYLIGNTDFSMVAATKGEDCCHNGILLKKEDSPIYFVPYDFDMAGIVDAPYAEPNPRFDLRSVTSRLYRGHCRFNPQLESTIAAYMDHQDEVMRIIDKQEGMDDRTRNRVRGFIEGFYEIMADSRWVEGRIYGACLGEAD